MGKRTDWIRWLLCLASLVLGIRLAVAVALPFVPNPFAWGSSLMLGAALTFFLLPLPHEHLLPRDVGPPVAPGEPPRPPN